VSAATSRARQLTLRCSNHSRDAGSPLLESCMLTPSTGIADVFSYVIRRFKELPIVRISEMVDHYQNRLLALT
jgi:hypothetical protein